MVAVPVILIPFFSSLTPAEVSTEILAKLAASGAQVANAVDLQQKVLKRARSVVDDHSYVFVGTGGTEKAIAQFLSQVRPRPPILLLSHDGNNSLPAAMETRAYLQERGVSARIIHGPLDRLVERIRDWCAFARIEERLRSSRLGLVGEPSSWLVASHVSPVKVRRRWGLTIDRYPLAALLDLLHEELGPDCKSRLEHFVKQATAWNVSWEELVQVGVVAQELARFTRDHKLDAITVACFSLLQETGISGCYALSCLNDSESLVAGCEGDVPATFTMLLAKLLTGRAGFMANVTDVDPDSNSAVFAHCTIASSLVDTYEVTTHFESGRSVAIQGQLRPQPVTVLKVFGDDLARYWVSSGIVVPHKRRTNGCRTQVRVELAEPVGYFLEQSLANHHVIVPGNYAPMVRDFFHFVLRE